MSKGKNDNDNSKNTSFIGDVFSVIDKIVCESTKESYGDRCHYDVHVGGNDKYENDHGGEGARHTERD